MEILKLIKKIYANTAFTNMIMEHPHAPIPPKFQKKSGVKTTIFGRQKGKENSDSGKCQEVTCYRSNKTMFLYLTSLQWFLRVSVFFNYLTKQFLKYISYVNSTVRCGKKQIIKKTFFPLFHLMFLPSYTRKCSVTACNHTVAESTWKMVLLMTLQSQTTELLPGSAKASAAEKAL